MIELDYKKDGELFNKTAMKWANDIYNDKEYIEKEKRIRGEIKFKKNFKDNPTKPTQMRKFYDQLLKWHNEVIIEKKEMEDVLPFIKMLNSKIEYAYSRELLSKTFRKMMAECIDNTNDEQALRNFKLFFESVLGFYKGRK